MIRDAFVVDDIFINLSEFRFKVERESLDESPIKSFIAIRFFNEREKVFLAFKKGLIYIFRYVIFLLVWNSNYFVLLLTTNDKGCKSSCDTKFWLSLLNIFWLYELIAYLFATTFIVIFLKRFLIKGHPCYSILFFTSLLKRERKNIRRRGKLLVWKGKRDEKL